MGTSGQGRSVEPLPRTVPWYQSQGFIAAHIALIVAFALILVLVQWRGLGINPWPGSAIMFALGAAVGAVGTRAMVEMLRAAEPYQRLREEFTQGRFLTLACPMLSPRYWRSVRAMRRALRDKGIAPPPTVTRILANVPPLLLVPVILAAHLRFHMPPGAGFLAFLGCCLTWLDLPNVLYSRGFGGNARSQAEETSEQ